MTAALVDIAGGMLGDLYDRGEIARLKDAQDLDREAPQVDAFMRWFISPARMQLFESRVVGALRGHGDFRFFLAERVLETTESRGPIEDWFLRQYVRGTSALAADIFRRRKDLTPDGTISLTDADRRAMSDMFHVMMAAFAGYLATEETSGELGDYVRWLYPNSEWDSEQRFWRIAA
jgi:hypothetical protein